MKKIASFLVPSAFEFLAIALCFSFLIAGSAFFAASHTEASNPQELTGFAWSGSATASGVIGGAGWISFNCANFSNACSTSNYSVVLDGSNNLVGYAWSPNFGWLKFGGLSGFPAGSGTSAQNAQLSSGRFIGWARFCSGTVNRDCNSASRTDFDGWVSLSGTNYGVTVNGVQLAGYAWGGPSIGWLSFQPVGSVPNGCRSACIGNPTTVDLEASTSGGTNSKSLTVAAGTTISLSWTSSGVAASACSSSSSDPSDKVWPSIQRPTSSGNSPVAYTVTRGVTLSIDCPDGRGGYAHDSVSISVAGTSMPTAILQAKDASGNYTANSVTLDPGTPIFLQWSSSNASRCDALSPGFATGETVSGTNVSAGTVNGSQTFTVRCVNATGSASAVSAVTVNQNNAAGTTGCPDPAGGAELSPGGTKNYYEFRQGVACVAEPRTCNDNGDGTYSLGGNSSAVYASCTIDPNYKEQ